MCERVVAVLAEDPEDVPFALLYWLSWRAVALHRGLRCAPQVLVLSAGPHQLVERSSGA